MELAIKAARQCRGDPKNPRVGAVAVVNRREVGTAFRGEVELNQHAEYVLLEEHLRDVPLAGATVYTTLEPCTTRHSDDKKPCANRLIERKVGRVVIGMLDPNLLISGVGWKKLRQANIKVTVMSDSDLLDQLAELNRNFIHAIESDVVNQAAREIAELAKRKGIPRQQELSATSLRECLESLRRISHGELRIEGREAGYFKRFLERVDEGQSNERVRAFIRLTPFEPDELSRLSWFDEFYHRLDEAVTENKLVIDYVFLIRTPTPTNTVKEFIDRYKQFARKIAILQEEDQRLTPDMLHPSIVLFETQRIAFTHDRGDHSSLVEATEWICGDHFNKLQEQYSRIELISTPYFQQSPSGS